LPNPFEVPSSGTGFNRVSAIESYAADEGTSASENSMTVDTMRVTV
jgi:hypothetical protein